MKIQFICDSGANIRSAHESGFIDVEELTGLSAEEWKELSEEEKFKMAEEWAWQNNLAIYFEEQE